MPDAKSVAEVRSEIADMLDPNKADQKRWCAIDLSYQMLWPETDEPPVVLLRDQTAWAVKLFIDSFNQYRDQMRRCEDEKCRRWFIGRRNKQFCSTVCLSRVTTERLRKGGLPCSQSSPSLFLVFVASHPTVVTSRLTWGFLITRNTALAPS
jgi:hypothetical protein